MALLLQNELTGAQGDRQRWFRRKTATEEASDRTLVSPLMLKRPAGRLIYWLVFALLLVSTLVALGPVYWVFSGALKSSIEIFQTPRTFWPVHPRVINYTNAWYVLD